MKNCRAFSNSYSRVVFASIIESIFFSFRDEEKKVLRLNNLNDVICTRSKLDDVGGEKKYT